MIIGLGHKAQTGKDTIAKILQYYWKYERRAFADHLKRVCGLAFGFTEEQLFGSEKMEVDPYWGFSPAWAFQFVGTDMFRNMLDPDIWVKAATKDMSPGDNIVFTDMRFPNEAQKIRDMGGILIRVDRDLDKRGDIGRPHDHISETALDDWTDWDWILDNNTNFEDIDFTIPGGALLNDIEVIVERELAQRRINKTI